jgi:tetratricopeptide (TPR) repeat protein
MAEAADFFVSYTGADQAWAEWVAWQLEQAGYRVTVQAWDFEPGDNFVIRMRDALEQADRTLALVSAAYLASPYCTDEWTGAFLHDPDGHNRLLQVRIEACELPRLLRAQIYIDLVGLPRQQARARLLNEVKRGRRKPSTEPPFPHDQVGSAEPRFPGHGLEVTNLPPRNPDFSGRSTLLKELHETLMTAGTMAVVQAAAVHGLGGVGKTQLALEYAHRYATDYDVIWWVPAEQAVAIPGSMARLARRLGVPEQADQSELLASLWDVLRERNRWLLVYDNAERPRQLDPYRPPGGNGRVLVTSRTPTWGQGAATVRLDVLDRDEAVGFLRRRTGSADIATLAALAEALGDLPLALEQAAAYMDETQTSSADYLALYQEHGSEMLALGEPLTTEQTVATTWKVALDQVQATPAARELLSLCAFLAPDDIPRTLLSEHDYVLPEPLRRTVGRPLALNETISALRRYSLVTVTAETLTVHRLLQTVVRAALDNQARDAWATAAVLLLRAGFPHSSNDVGTWAECERLLPHVLAVADHGHRLTAESKSVRWLLSHAARYVYSRGQYRQALTLHQQVLAACQQAFGDDHPGTLESMHNLAETHRILGDLQDAHDLFDQTLTARRRVLGDDHPNTLQSMHSLAVTRRNLGDLQGARDMHNQVLEARRQVLDDDHPDTLQSMHSLAGIRRDLGDVQGAHDTNEQLLTIRRRVLGDDHPETLVSMQSLAETLRLLGDLQGARDLFDRTLVARRRVLGDDHPDTLWSMHRLAETRHGLGDVQGARDMHQQVLTARRRVLGDDHPNTLSSMHSLAESRQALGDLHGALELHQQVLAARRRTRGDDHPSTRSSMKKLADVHRLLGELSS